MRDNQRKSQKALIVGLTACLLWGGHFEIARSDETATSRPPGASDEAAAEVARLSTLWNGWQERTKSLKVEGWRFIGICRKAESAVTRDEMLDLVYSKLLPIVEAGELDRDALDKLTSELFSMDREQIQTHGRIGRRWERFTFLSSSIGKRAEYKSESGTKVMVRREGREQDYDSRIHQASLYPAETAMHMEKLDDFLYTTPLTRLPSLRIESGPNGRRHLTNGGFLLEYFPSSGFVFRDSRQLPTGAYLFDRIQELPFESTVGPPLGRLVARLNYRHDETERSLLQHAELYLVDSASNNPDVTDEDFKISIPTETTVVDFGKEIPASATKADGRHLAQRVSGPVEDALAYSQSSNFARVVPPKPADGGEGQDRKWPLALIAANVAGLLLVVGWWMVMRRRMRS